MAKASDRAYAEIRAMILSGELASGDALVEEALAERCGVSRTPVRDALRRLESELLIRRTDTARTFVADWSIEDVTDVFELRAMLEGHAAMRAAERVTASVMEQLRDCNAALRSAVFRANPLTEKFLERNREFHAIILDTASSPRLSGLLGVLIEQPVVWRTAQHYGPEAFKRSHNEHEDLLAAFARRDGNWAKAVMKGHVLRASHAYADAHSGLVSTDREASTRHLVGRREGAG